MGYVRESVFEVVAAHPRIVITGAAGTGKSSLCRFIVTALAYACDPRAERQDKVKGLDMLGASWIHGPILPIYVSLRDFCNAKGLFPQSLAASFIRKPLKLHQAYHRQPGEALWSLI